VTSLVALRQVGLRYGSGRPALHDVDLTVHAGSFTGIVGPSGSGKTSLLRILTGALRPTAGTVERLPGLRVGYVPQVETVDWTFPVTVSDVALMGRAPAHRLPWPTASERRAVAEVLDRLGLGGLGSRPLHALSGGQQQRVFVARALLQDAPLLVLDEPSSGVDVRTRHDLLHLLADLHRSDGVAIVVTTHDLNGLATHLPHLVALQQRVIASGPPEAVLVPRVLEATFGAPMEVLVHSGLRVVVDGPAHLRPDHTHPPRSASTPTPTPTSTTDTETQDTETRYTETDDLAGSGR
jgi:ABC-type Mn2+/Zn2+ transport system ATPase subunit